MNLLRKQKSLFISSYIFSSKKKVSRCTNRNRITLLNRVQIKIFREKISLLLGAICKLCKFFFCVFFINFFSSLFGLVGFALELEKLLMNYEMSANCFYVVDYSTGMRFSKCLNRCMHIVRMCTTDQCAPGIILAVENIFIFNVKLYKLSIIDGFIYSYHCFICFGLFCFYLFCFSFLNWY